MRRSNKGFTLIELMVVILIIGLLAAVLMISIGGAFSDSNERIAQNEIQLLRTAVDSFERDQGKYPPNTIAELPTVFQQRAMMADNKINSSSESMLFCIRTHVGNGPYVNENDLFKEGKLINTDKDKKTQNVAKVDGEAIPLELADPWGNPYIYIRLKHLKSKSFIFTLADGSRLTIEGQKVIDALKDKETGRLRASTFVIWSLGEDGKNEYGAGDDIASWH